jgi:hypothetical protein
MPFMGPLPHSEAGLELRPGASSPLGMVGQGGASKRTSQRYEILFPLAVLLPRKATRLRNQSQLGCRQDSTHYSYLFHNAAISSKLLVPRFMIHHSLVGATRESGMIPKVLREGSWAVGNSA